MLTRVLVLTSALCLMALPGVHAAEPMEAWTPDGAMLRANGAGIALPQTVGGLSLVKSGEASSGGRAVDNYAQYLSADEAIQATLYIYMPTYADASLAAYMTDRAIMERFGGATRRTAYAPVALDGQADRAIRAVYDDAADGALTTAAGFVHAGRWIVKLRVTGPTARRAEVLAGLDAMLAGLTFDDGASPHPVATARMGSCPAAPDGDATLKQGQGAPIALPDPRMPRDGRDALCVRGTVATAEGRYDMLQLAGRDDGPIIVPVDDSGTVVALDPVAGAGGYRLSIHMVGRTEVYGTYDRAPTGRQVAAILAGTDPQTAQAAMVAAYAATGDVMIERAGAR